MRVLRTLIVDDSPVFLDSALKLFARARFIEVQDQARSAALGLELAERLHPDLALVGDNLLDLDGSALAARLKALPTPPCVIVLSFSDQPQIRQKALRAGADGFLSKFELTTRLLPMAQRLCGTTPQSTV